MTEDEARDFFNAWRKAPGPADSKAAFKGVYHFVLKDKDGNIKDEWDEENLIVNQGLNHILSTEFASGTQITSWFLAPFTTNYTPLASDTASTIVGNAGETTSYSQSTRVAFTPTVASQAVTNSASQATFTFTGSLTIYGVFLTSASAKSATSGTLFSAVLFSTAKTVGSGDQLLVTYTCTAASA